MQLRLNNYKWHESGNTRVCGYCFIDGHLLREKQLCDYFAQAQTERDLVQRLKAANGFFAVVIKTDKEILIATDRLRRFPLFYTDEGDISDDPYALPSSGKWDEQGKMFYEVSGAVLPGHTLLRDIHQLPAASYAVYRSRVWTVQPYATYLCTRKDERAVTVDELDKVMTSVFERMRTSLQGRQVIVPLTAGNDSRLILCLLRRMGVENVLCYTVVGADSHEWEGAHEAAQRLGYPHIKIDMQNSDVSELCTATPDDFERYYRFVGAFSNFCWLYDYVAIRYMEKQGLLSETAVFVPGHSGDSIGGSHLDKAGVNERTSIRGLVRRMYYVSFEYRKDRRVWKWLTNYFETNRAIGYTSYSMYQNLIMQHRQAYNIVNSTRVYDFCGYEVRMPLWDNDLYDLFSHLPYACLAESRLYRDYCRFVMGLFELTAHEKSPRVSWIHTAWRAFAKSIIPKTFIRLLRKLADPVGEVRLSRPLGDELSQFLGYPHTCTNSNELLVQWYLMKVYQYFHSRSF